MRCAQALKRRLVVTEASCETQAGELASALAQLAQLEAMDDVLHNLDIDDVPSGLGGADELDLEAMPLFSAVSKQTSAIALHSFHGPTLTTCFRAWRDLVRLKEAGEAEPAAEASPGSAAGSEAGGAEAGAETGGEAAEGPAGEEGEAAAAPAAGGQPEAGLPPAVVSRKLEERLKMLKLEADVDGLLGTVSAMSGAAGNIGELASQLAKLRGDVDACADGVANVDALANTTAKTAASSAEHIEGLLPLKGLQPVVDEILARPDNTIVLQNQLKAVDIGLQGKIDMINKALDPLAAIPGAVYTLDTEKLPLKADKTELDKMAMQLQKAIDKAVAAGGSQLTPEMEAALKELAQLKKMQETLSSHAKTLASLFVEKATVGDLKKNEQRVRAPTLTGAPTIRCHSNTGMLTPLGFGVVLAGRGGGRPLRGRAGREGGRAGGSDGGEQGRALDPGGGGLEQGRHRVADSSGGRAAG